jgi:predicted nuclease of predicted toxin-antitoxin system
VKFLLDENQSPNIADLLAEAGHDAVHVRDLDMEGSPDVDVLAAARGEHRVVISADTDFGELLAASNADGPSILLLRRQQQRRAHEIASLILANLDQVAQDLQSGAVVVLDDDRVRIRSLPFRPD